MEKSLDGKSLRTAWDQDGYIIQRSLLAQDAVAKVEAEVVERIRQFPPEAHPRERWYSAGPNYLIFPETAPSPVARNAEDYVSRVFNCHAEGFAREIARHPDITDVVGELLGFNLDCFQSQFIFKNPGVIGQPWHQDSYYFEFDHQPQVGVWVALSQATRQNGCLWVLPGSHREPIHEHVPDRRASANTAYLEIIDYDFSSEIPVLMAPGDVLFFHSYLMHKSTDNFAEDRRAALVYHYGQSGTKALNSQVEENLSSVNRWIPVRRAA